MVALTTTSQRPRLALLALAVLIGQGGAYTLHFAGERHAVSGTTGELIHAPACDAHGVTPHEQQYAPDCAEEHDNHACEVWASLHHRIAPAQGVSLAPAPVATEAREPPRAAVAPRGAALTFAPKQSPPASA